MLVDHILVYLMVFARVMVLVTVEMDTLERNVWVIKIFMIYIYVYCVLNLFSLLDSLSISLILTLFEQTLLSEEIKSKEGILLYRATRDGFTTKAFHEKCDGKANTLTLIQTDNKYVFGGFASAEWTSAGKFISDSKAFIFNSRMGNKIRNKLYKYNVKNPEKALYGGSEYGPTFGDIDIVIKSNSNENRDSYNTFFVNNQTESSYEFLHKLPTSDPNYLAGEKYFKTREIEVYQIFNIKIITLAKIIKLLKIFKEYFLSCLLIFI
jgi:hypothetical protein